jgi:putative acetyltransferase
MHTRIRPIAPTDNAGLARVIRTTLMEFGAAHTGTVYDDPTTDALYELFQTPRSVYHVAERNGLLLGGGGIYPTAGLPPDTCELVKMYLLPEGRGSGLGRTLIETCFTAARAQGFSRIYLETMPELKKALSLYTHFGFAHLDGPMGHSGHSGCSRWMLKTL